MIKEKENLILHGFLRLVSVLDPVFCLCGHVVEDSLEIALGSIPSINKVFWSIVPS